MLELTFKCPKLGAIVGYREKFDPARPTGFDLENIGKVTHVNSFDPETQRFPTYTVEFPDGVDDYEIHQLVLIENPE